jgi:iron complex outermembrane receptor protein
MSSYTFKKGLLASSIAMILAGASAQATAADEATAKVNKDEVEVIKVTGIRGSLEASMNTKRFSNAVVDAVSAEDIGKFPDNNVAEALGRIPGVTVSRQFGEGSSVSIRGASNQLTLTTLNGQNVASTGWYSQQAIDRSFNYSMLPPEMIAGLEVYKSSQADLLEGGIGGTVVVETRKPLDLEAFTVFGSVKGSYSSASEETDPSASALVSWKNDDETFGVLAAIGSSEYSLVRRGDEALTSWGGRIAPTHFEQNRDRTAFDVALQYKPTDAMEFGLHYMSLELEANSVNTQVWIPQNLDNCSSENAQGVPTKCTTVAADNQSSYWDVRPRNATMKSELFAADFTYEGDNYTLEVQAGSSEATGGTDFETNVAYISGVNGAVGTIDATGNVVNYDLEQADYALPAAGEYAGWEGLQTGSIVNQPNTDEETYAQADLTFDVEFGAITSIKTGLRVSSHEVKQEQNRPDLTGYDGGVEAGLIDGSRFSNGTLKAGSAHLPIQAPNTGEMIAYTNEKVQGWIQERSGYAVLEEDSMSAYVMANFDGDGIRGNFGLRYISTDTSSTAFEVDPTFVDPSNSFNNGYGTKLVETEGDYNHVLPSVNIVVDAAEDVIIRFSAASVLARPNYDDMFSNSSLAGYNDTIQGNETVIVGNPDLKPFKAFQSDLGVEWYYGPSSMVAVAYFVKEVSTFTTFSNTPDQSIGIIDPDTGVDSWLVQSKEDGSGGTIQGIEFQIQHALDNGFGTVFNYTYADAEAEASNYVDGNSYFSDSSEHTVNAVGYYENDDFSARVAYTWRSEYMIRETGFYGARQHQDFGTLDLSASYNVTDNITLTADVTNLLEEDSIQVGRDQGEATNWRTSNGYPMASYEGEARYSLGAQFRF